MCHCRELMSVPFAWCAINKFVMTVVFQLEKHSNHILKISVFNNYFAMSQLYRHHSYIAGNNTNHSTVTLLINVVSNHFLRSKVLLVLLLEKIILICLTWFANLPGTHLIKMWNKYKYNFVKNELMAFIYSWLSVMFITG